MKVKTNGIEINYEVEGNGPWITLSHSLACNLHMWDDQMELLTKRFKVLRFDTRGHGQSTAPEGDYTLDQMAEDVHGLFAHLGITKTHWVGLSMGGRMATHVAAADRDLPVAGLIMLGYPLHPPGQPQKRRDAHLPSVQRPMLIVQGSRDTFGTPEELGPVLEPLVPRATLHVIRGGDHSFKFGYRWRSAHSISLNHRGGYVDARYTNGVANSADIWRDQNSISHLNTNAVYAQDTFTKNRFTAIIGVRLDMQDDAQLAADVPANPFFPTLMPAISFQGADAGVTSSGRPSGISNASQHSPSARRPPSQCRRPTRSTSRRALGTSGRPSPSISHTRRLSTTSTPSSSRPSPTERKPRICLSCGVIWKCIRTANPSTSND